MTRPNTKAIPPPSGTATLEELRVGINAVDARLVALLNERAALSKAVGEVKRASPGSEVFHPSREAQVLHGLAAANPGPLPEEDLRAIYRQILSSSRKMQHPLAVAYLGPEGTFSHLAARSLLGELATFRPKADLSLVFSAVENNECDLGVVPLENSLQGSVAQTLDLFMRYKVFIKAESSFPIRHCLLSRASSLSEVRRVYSHPQPLAQCGIWLKGHLPQAPVVPLESTAAAAGRAFEEEGAAAVAHCDLADSLGLHTLAKNIEDLPGNRTRFVIIGRTPADRPGPDRTSLLFTVADKPGSLLAVLRCFAGRGINMRKLESRPMPGESWKYVFFADLECDIYDDAHAGALDEAAVHCLEMRVLGSYPSTF
jgi:chorismate mutase domain of proteobacterial P-protein, clade 2